jgi:hypothetical protein
MKLVLNTKRKQDAEVVFLQAELAAIRTTYDLMDKLATWLDDEAAVSVMMNLRVLDRKHVLSLPDLPSVETPEPADKPEPGNGELLDMQALAKQVAFPPHIDPISAVQSETACTT